MHKILSDWAKNSFNVAEFRPKNRFETFSLQFCENNLQLLRLEQDTS